MILSPIRDKACIGQEGVRVDPAEMSLYTIQAEAEKIILRTSSFRADRGSVLHSGIYSRELSSSFLAATVALIVLMVLSFYGGLSVMDFIVAIVVFAVVFPVARVYIFKEPYLESIFDKREDTITISLKRPLFSKRLQKPLSSLKDIKIIHSRFEPENPDAVAFVEKIALQHGTVIPGFGETKEFYNITLEFDDQNITILTLRDKREAETFIEKLKQFL